MTITAHIARHRPRARASRVVHRARASTLNDCARSSFDDANTAARHVSRIVHACARARVDANDRLVLEFRTERGGDRRRIGGVRVAIGDENIIIILIIIVTIEGVS